MTGGSAKIPHQAATVTATAADNRLSVTLEDEADVAVENEATVV
jgi:hypothetical protein